jgi:hypothetical protein
MLDYSRENVQPATMVREKHAHSENKIDMHLILLLPLHPISGNAL